ncbi:MAG: hypothetical protein HC811_14085 [Flammeovirgaceae bacterium]|nr:hypothetical protein [Flammeovirgaceae bacterium]
MAIAISEIVETYKNRFQVGLPYVVEKPVDDLSLIITIPAFKEPDIEKILQSLAECEKPAGIVEILLVINAPAEATEDVLKINQKAFETARMLELPEFLQLRIIRSENIAKKYFGAGMARKIGMDEAVQRVGCFKKRWSDCLPGCRLYSIS